MTPRSTHRMVIRHDPWIGHLYVPHLRARIPNEDGGYYVRTNSLGFRSDLEFSKRRGERPRILFFGDSYTAGDGCDNRDRFPERVGEILDAEVYNYGLAGSGTDQQLLALERFARDVEADLVVLGVMVENIERIQVGSRESIDRVTGRRVLVPKPRFVLGPEGRLELRQVPVPRERRAVEDAEGRDYQKSFERRFPRITRLLSAYRYDPRWSGVRRAVDGWAPGMRSRILRAARFQPYRDYASPDSPGWRLMEAILDRFWRAVAPTPFLIAPLPPYWFYYDEIEPIYEARFAALPESRPGLEVVDVTRPLWRLPRREREGMRLPHDAHYSPLGHERVAEILAREIRGRGLLPERRERRESAPPAVRATGGQAGARPLHVLGLSCFYHNSAAALVRDGEVVAAAEEERFSRVKNDRRFPHHAANYCLEESGIHPDELAAVVYYDNASLTFERMLHTLAAVGPRGEDAWLRMMPSWVQYKLHLPRLVRRYLGYEGPVLQEVHHRSHAASAFLPSPFESAAILTVDGVGEWATASIGIGRDGRVELLKEMRFPHSLGLLYSAFTQFTGFKVNSGEYKLMGLAPYGEPRYVDAIRSHLVDIKNDGSIELNLDCFAFLSEPTMTNERFAELFGGPARAPDSWITQRERDLARSVQVVTEEVVMRMARHAHQLTGERALCMAGGVSLNCVANGRLLREGPFETLWIQPAAGDSGAALGAALDAYHDHFGRPREVAERSRQRGSLLGPAYGDEEIRAFLETNGHPYHEVAPAERAERVAELVAEGRVVGNFMGRAEFGPRALGARSILGDPRDREMQSKLNLKIKYRESFRPFAPSVLTEKAKDYFDLEGESPFMLLVAPVVRSRRLPFSLEAQEDLREAVSRPRSDVPAITHVDYSARIQTVDPRDAPAYHALIRSFESRTGCAVIVNTSFNVRGEPIVLTPDDAYRCFMRTEMDVLALGDFLLFKSEQAEWPEPKGHVEEHDEAQVTPRPRRLVRALHRIHAEDFLPVAEGLRRDGELQVSTKAARLETTWTDHRVHGSDGNVFAVPAELDASPPDPERMAAAISGFWAPGRATRELRPVLAKLLALGSRLPADDRFSEGVPESVYAMF